MTPKTQANSWGNIKQTLCFLGSKITAGGDGSHEIKRRLESYDQTRQHIQKQRRYFANKGPSSQGYGFSSGHVWVWELDYKESWALKNWCFWTVVLEKTLESLLDCNEIQPVLNILWKDWCWSWSSNSLAIWWEELTLLKRPECWERLKAGREGNNRGWDGWRASLTQWTWAWINFRSWWWTGRPGGLQTMGSQRVEHDWVTELNWIVWIFLSLALTFLLLPPWIKYTSYSMDVGFNQKLSLVKGILWNMMQ